MVGLAQAYLGGRALEVPSIVKDAFGACGHRSGLGGLLQIPRVVPRVGRHDRYGLAPS